MADREATASAPIREMLRMLYVEDNRLNAILFEESLRAYPALELRLAVDGADALAQLADWVPDVLVIDAHLPDMDGFALLSLLRQQTPLARLPAFMCSADTTPEDMARAHAAGFTGFWPKPIELEPILRDLQQIAAGCGKS